MMHAGDRCTLGGPDAECSIPGAIADLVTWLGHVVAAILGWLWGWPLVIGLPVLLVFLAWDVRRPANQVNPDQYRLTTEAVNAIRRCRQAQILAGLRRLEDTTRKADHEEWW